MTNLQTTSTPTSPSSSNSSFQSAKDRTECYRLMSIVLQRRLSLQAHRSALEAEHAEVNALLEKYDEQEESWDNETRLASYLRGRLEDIYAPSYEKKMAAEVCWEEEGDAGVSFGGAGKEEVEAIEGGRGWLDLKEEEERATRELEVLKGMLGGAEELCDRVEGDYGMILKESVATVSAFSLEGFVLTAADLFSLPLLFARRGNDATKPPESFLKPSRASPEPCRPAWTRSSPSGSGSPPPPNPSPPPARPAPLLRPTTSTSAPN